MSKDQEWIQKHFSELVEKYATKYVAVVNEEIAGIGDSAFEAEKKALEKYPDALPSVLLVPRDEDFVCLL
jgi:hypothetical protein